MLIFATQSETDVRLKFERAWDLLLILINKSDFKTLTFHIVRTLGCTVTKRYMYIRVFFF